MANRWKAGATDVKNLSHQVVSTPPGLCNWRVGPACDRTLRPSQLARDSPPRTADRRHCHHKCARPTESSRRTSGGTWPTIGVTTIASGSRCAPKPPNAERACRTRVRPRCLRCGRQRDGRCSGAAFCAGQYFQDRSTGRGGRRPSSALFELQRARYAFERWRMSRTITRCLASSIS